MEAKPEFRNRRETEVAILDALVDRVEEGMTVFELRAAVDADIDDIEEGLSALKEEGLIDVEESGEVLRIHPADRVVPDPSAGGADDLSFLEAIRKRLGL